MNRNVEALSTEYGDHNNTVDSGEKEVVIVEKEAVEKNVSVIVISDQSSSDDDVVFVEKSDVVDELKSNASGNQNASADQDTSGGYFGDDSGSSGFGSPPDRTEYLRLLYAGKGHLIPDKSLRPPVRFNSNDDITTSTPKKNANA